MRYDTLEMNGSIETHHSFARFQQILSAPTSTLQRKNRTFTSTMTSMLIPMTEPSSLFLCVGNVL